VAENMPGELSSSKLASAALKALTMSVKKALALKN